MTLAATPTTNTPNSIELISLAEVKKITGMGTTFIYGEISNGKFPRQRRVGEKASRWVKLEVIAWANSQPVVN